MLECLILMLLLHFNDYSARLQKYLTKFTVIVWVKYKWLHRLLKMLVWWKSFSPCHSFSVQMNSCLIVKARAYTDIVKMQSCKNKDPQHFLLDKNGISDKAHVYTIVLPTQTRGLGPLKRNNGQPSRMCTVIDSRSVFTQAPNMFFFVNFVIIL